MKNAGDILWEQLEEEARRLEERVRDMADLPEEKNTEELYKELMAKIKNRKKNTIPDDK